MPRAALLLCLALAPVSLAAEPPAPKEGLREYAKKSQGRYAYGQYIKGVKVGWQIDENKLGKHDGKEVLTATSESYFSTLVDKKQSVTTEKTVVHYELEGEGLILAADVHIVEDKKVTTRKAVRKGKALLLTTVEGKRKTERTVPIPKDTLAQSRRFETWLRSVPAKEAKFIKYAADWSEDDIDVKETYTFKGKKAVVWAGAALDVYVVRGEVQKAITKLELMADGTRFTEDGGLLSLKMEPEAIVKKLGAGIDLTAVSSIFIDRDLGEAAKVEKLTLELSGLDDFEVPQSDRQRVRRDKSKAIVELSRDHRLPKGAPLSKEERASHLKATSKIQSDHEAIRKEALKIIGKETDPVRKATLLAKWVYRVVRKSYRDNADNALAVLDSKAGDCTEHTLLFVALARAAGVPAREVSGLAYAKAGGKPMFGWHAWAEIHDGAQWVSIDPTWNQVYVDATHITLGIGSEDMGWVTVTGKLKIRVLKVTTR